MGGANGPVHWPMILGRVGPQKLAQKYNWDFLAQARLVHAKNRLAHRASTRPIVTI